MPTRIQRTQLKPRKQPAQARAEHTVAAIVEAAARILETGGLPGYTTNAVAERAGVSIGSLYQYFPNKDALTAALIDRETAILLHDLQVAQSSTAFAAGMRVMVRAAVAHQMRRPQLARLLDFEERRLPLGARDRQVAVALSGLIMRLFTVPDAPYVRDRESVAADLIAIVKGMVDAAGERGETDAAALTRRVLRAVTGVPGMIPARRCPWCGP